MPITPQLNPGEVIVDGVTVAMLLIDAARSGLHDVSLVVSNLQAELELYGPGAGGGTRGAGGLDDSSGLA